MSYVVHIWEQPSPATWAEADALQASLDGQAAPLNRKFVKLALALLQTFPHRRDARGASPWIEGAPDGVVDEASWALGIDTAQIDRVVPVLVTRALALGLTVYDGQSGEVYLPGGWRLTPEGREPLTWPSAVDLEPSSPPDDRRAHLEARVRALALPRFEPKGFVLEWRPFSTTSSLTLSMTRQTPLGAQRIGLTPQLRSEHWEVWLSCELEPNLPADLATWCRPQHDIKLVSADLPDLAAFYKDPGRRNPFDTNFQFLDKDQLEQFLGLYASWAERELLPVLDACADVSGYLSVDGREAGPGVIVEAATAGLAIAHCAGDPQLAERGERYGQQRTPHPRPGMFRSRAAELAAFPQYFGIFAGSRG